MIEVITPPSNLVNSDLFLAGGISNCPNWQEVVIDALRDYDQEYSWEDEVGLTVVNPRNSDYKDNEESAKTQIEWEFNRLERAASKLFWFCKETLCPITLFELGKCCKSNKLLYIGCHPDYKRKLDVVTQIGLERPELKVVFSLSELVQQVIDYEY